jgi:hypothetical protein
MIPCNYELMSMDKKSTENFIERIYSFSKIHNNIHLTCEGKKMNIITDASGLITAHISTFHTSKLHHGVDSPSKPFQTIILNPNGTNEIINYEKGNKN